MKLIISSPFSAIKLFSFTLLAFSLVSPNSSRANDLYETALINYENRQANNDIETLNKALLEKKVKLDFHSRRGFLDALLKELDIPINSQTLIFSKTSFHRKQIYPSNPRALYFNDEIYVGWVPGTKLLEIAISDPELGAVFYTLEQKQNETIQFKRDDSCLSCHVSSRTLNEPGFFIRSVFPDESGEPISRLGSDTIDHSSDIGSRWGGWYVTGKKTEIHRGNTIYTKDSKRIAQPHKALTTHDLNKFFNPDKYLAQSSDIEALMVLEHQVQMHNIFTQRNFQAIKMIEAEKSINRALGESGRRPLTEKILHNASDQILEYMLFTDEIPLRAIEGNANFKEEFAKDKISGKNGDSLYKLSFKERISELPCSWLIYSQAFKGLQPDLKKIVLKQLEQILTAEDIPINFIHLRKSRSRIHQLLLETLDGYPAS
ncbi:hypothetical protein PQO03_13135 [Lentisphaera profundi]|uniref:Cytochrome c domain-containing protein n=1 Tax=Lentisphaera profundi TaxID=1658616 RepID=A0ABY7VX10_9BACT|nr:hypothetical protein [Lentisphaera profundi]WDE98780.1 hypothetical protein PQO03_13135 [Lentisphaera profundi]